MTKCPRCEFDGSESCTHRLRLQSMTCPAPFFDHLGRFHEHPGEYLESYICDRGHRWDVKRPGRKQCQPCAQGPVVETPSFPVDGGERICFEELERLKFERREKQRLEQFLKYEANLIIVESLFKNDEPLPDFCQLTLEQLTELKRQYDERHAALWDESKIESKKEDEEEEEQSLSEEVMEVVEDVGEVVATALEATNDLLSEFV